MPIARTTLFLTVGTLLAIATTAGADAKNGRYKAEIIQSGSTPQVFLLDTRDGHFWTWTQTIRGSDQELRYEGRVRPGKAAGETLFRTGVDPRR